MNEAPSTSRRTASTRTRVLDVGGSHVTAAIVETCGRSARIVRREDRDIDPHVDTAALLDSIARPARDVDGDARACTVAMPGPFDDTTGIGHFADVGKFASLSGVPSDPSSPAASASTRAT